MALNIAAAAAAAQGANLEFLDVFQAAGPVAARDASSEFIVPRQDSNVPTVNMFVDGDSGAEYVASVVNACGGKTTLAMQCTTASGFVAGCSAGGPTVTVTYGSSTYGLETVSTTRTRGIEVTATVKYDCRLEGNTKADCTMTVGGEAQGTSTGFTETFTLSGTNYRRYDVALTAGAEKTAQATAECKSAGNALASTKSVALWGLVGVVGLASLLGF